MTGAPSSAGAPSPYVRIFTLPGALAFSSSAAVTRMPMAMVSLGMVLTLNHIYGDWTTPGFMTAAYVLASAAVTPVYARLFDRYGQRTVGLPLIILQAVGFVSFALCAQAHVSLVFLYALAIFLGLTSFSVGALVRTRWARAMADGGEDGSLLDTAYSLESAIDEIAFIFGPILVASLATAASPVLPFYVCALLEGIGGLIFFCLPSAHGRAIHTLTSINLSTDQPVEGESKQENDLSSVSQTDHAKRLAFLYPGMIILCLIFVFFNASFSAFDVTMTALMRSMEKDSLLGLQLALFAVGSCIGALIFGSRPHRGDPWRRLIILMTYLAAGFLLIALFSQMHSLAAIGVVELVSGLSIAPLFATGNLMVKQIVPASSLTEGLSWLSTAGTIGSALGSAFSGRILDSWRAVWGLSSLWILVAVACLLILVGQVRYGRAHTLTA